MSEPLVSILIPTWNRVGMLRQALESAERQTYEHVEIVVSDNASTDGTWPYLKDKAAANPRLRVVRQPVNLGHAGNLRFLLRQARGSFVKFLDDDDLLLPFAVERLSEPLRRDPRVVLATSRRQYVDERLRKIRVTGDEAAFSRDVVADGIELGNLILARRQNVIGMPSMTLFRRDRVPDPDRILSMNGRRYLHAGDLVMHLEVMAQGKVAYLHEPVVHVRHHAGQGTFEPEQPLLRLMEWCYMIEDAKPLGFLADRDLERQALTCHLVWAGQLYFEVAPVDRQGVVARSLTWAAERLRRLDRIPDQPFAPQPPGCTVVTVAAPGHAGALHATLAAIGAGSPTIPYDVVVVDAAGEDEATGALLGALEGDFWVVKAQPGRSPWLKGLDWARAARVALVPPGARPAPGWLDELVKQLEARPDQGGAELLAPLAGGGTAPLRLLRDGLVDPSLLPPAPPVAAAAGHEPVPPADGRRQASPGTTRHGPSAD